MSWIGCLKSQSPTPVGTRGLKSRMCPPYPHACREGEVNLLFNVTIYDISVIYVTAHRCAGGLKKKLTYGRAPNAIDISQGSLTCPSKHRHGTTLFIRWFRHTAPFSRLLRSRWGYGGHILDLTPRALTGAHACRKRRLKWGRYIALVADTALSTNLT